MSEVRIRPRQVLILIIVFILLLLMVHHNGKANCPLPDFLQNVYLSSKELPTIYAITPTYYRPVQKAELTRLSHVIALVPNIHWIIVEDANKTSALVKNLVQEMKLGMRSTLLHALTPPKFKLKQNDPNWIKPRGVVQRNAALDWLHTNINLNIHSLVYFMDDDNTYSTELFAEMIKIEKGRVGVWPVGLVGGLMVEKPLLNENNEITGFNAVWNPDRLFPIDMAGFAISSVLFFEHPKANFSLKVRPGDQETEILRHLTQPKDMQPLANYCKKVLVWHTRTEKPKLDYEIKLNARGAHSDDNMEV